MEGNSHEANTVGYRVLSPEEIADALQQIDHENDTKETKRQNDI